MSLLTLGKIAEMLEVPVPPEYAELSISGMNTLEDATETELSLLSSDAFVRQFRQTRAAAVLVRRKVKAPPDIRKPILVVDDADLAAARVLEMLAPPVPRPPAGVDTAARVAPSAKIGREVAIGPFVTVGERVQIGDNVVLHPGVYIGDDVTIGDDCVFHANVVVRERIEIGRRVIIHAGSMIGSDGFGYRWDGKRHVKVPQIGRVLIEDDVEIGSCVCVDRAKFSMTVIGQGTKIDNLVQVGHNVRIGPHCIIVGQVGLAGSVTLGTGAVLGGQTAVRDHVTLGDGAIAAACSAIVEDVEPRMVVSGTPALPHRQHLREQAAMRRLPEMVVHLRKLEEQMAAMREELNRRSD